MHHQPWSCVPFFSDLHILMYRRHSHQQSIDFEHAVITDPTLSVGIILDYTQFYVTAPYVCGVLRYSGGIVSLPINRTRAEISVVSLYSPSITLGSRCSLVAQCPALRCLSQVRRVSIRRDRREVLLLVKGFGCGLEETQGTGLLREIDHA
ncbi:uncharacterized protein EI97DRAFT_23093 [Westerdykella ornata]|uniref:Uncharacterized protein n=1 Tax=Westerdykella ornata TaxID=318751 RepID=A0A6A6JYP5_WESOR|nr:uncharacterized protein EI97DRAFT_23093 [Westerdykella ornata]KAF2281213.1 hypothetical protein EI97DRAFT_23093 [Westerdykella ornata]